MSLIDVVPAVAACQRDGARAWTGARAGTFNRKQQKQRTLSELVVWWRERIRAAIRQLLGPLSLALGVVDNRERGSLHFLRLAS